jgi:hypothetical protein
MSRHGVSTGADHGRVLIRPAEERDLAGIHRLLVRTWHDTYKAV